MLQEEVLLLGLVVSFAAFVTTHLALVVGLARRRPAWQALVALAAVPMAPYWGIRAGLLVRSITWLVSAIAYLTLRLASR